MIIGDKMNKKKNDMGRFKTEEYLRYGDQHNPDQEKELEEFRRRQDLYIRFKKIKHQSVKQFLLVVIVIAVCVLFYRVYQSFLRPVDVNMQVDKTSIHYVNDLYASDGRHYENLLDEEQKLMYMEWLQSVKNIDETLALNYEYFKGQTYEEVLLNLEFIYRVMMMDHPELFYLSSYGSVGTNVYDLELQNHYILNNKTVIEILERGLIRKVDELYNNWRTITTDIAKEAAVYNWLSKKSDTASDNRLYDTSIPAFLTKKTNHKGAALASQILLRRLDVKSDLVYGYYKYPRMFNLVYLEDGAYYYDAGIAVEVSNKLNIEEKQEGLNIKAYEKHEVYYIKPLEEELGYEHIINREEFIFGE